MLGDCQSDGTSTQENANYAWMQHIPWHLKPTGQAAVVLANGSMSSNHSGEEDIRRRIIEADVVECIIALPPQLFFNTPIPELGTVDRADCPVPWNSFTRNV